MVRAEDRTFVPWWLNGSSVILGNESQPSGIVVPAGRECRCNSKSLRRDGGLAETMHLDDRQWAGLTLFLGTVQFAMGLTIAEIVYPNYSVAANYISDLGVGTAAAPIFNGSIIVLGALLVLCSWFVFRAYRDRLLMGALALAGIGAAGVGIFSEGSPYGLHSGFSLITFVFAALATILAFRVVRPPLGYLSIVFGVASFAALGLYVSGNYLGLGTGGMERMVVWPVLVWGIAFGGYLLGVTAASTTAPTASG